jgi:SAM-dependent methyltransferase
MPASSRVDEWRAEEAFPFSGWDFSHLDGRVVEEQPPWSYLDVVRAALRGARSLLDLGTGGGEVLAQLRDAFPPRVVATEAWAPNVVIARERLSRLGVQVVPYAATETSAKLPFADRSFDVVVSRHEAYEAVEVARVLTPRGHFVTQQVHAGSLAELRGHFGEPMPFPHVTVEGLSAELRGAGLRVDRAEEWHGTMTFRDVGAIVYFLKNVPWEAPGFSVERDLAVLDRLQHRLDREGSLVFGIGYLLIEARTP